MNPTTPDALRDLLGQPLAVGDRVATTIPGSLHLHLGWVVSRPLYRVPVPGVGVAFTPGGRAEVWRWPEEILRLPEDAAPPLRALKIVPSAPATQMDPDEERRPTTCPEALKAARAVAWLESAAAASCTLWAASTRRPLRPQTDPNEENAPYATEV